ncbi:non-homologous end joining protein Ku [Nitrosomonas supralitoralis]|uniref:Non-homologous end joining protein Ku n=1 Tax=Nitrosomonas supralitoralis TaxID=2116706 RepID=A0A2P7NR94_9PROT|nr:Ku protein [Nitrosomonas supralitoralis]PSJ15968.1 Ku protein [Nitrosomonas supralitoralis]
MPHRPYWKGHIRLSLVTFPVRLYPAVTQSEKVRLHKYDKDTGQRIHYQNVNEDGDVVEADDIVKGYEYEKGVFIPIEDKEIEKLRLESKQTIDLVQFADLSSIDPIYFDNPYYVSPDSKLAQEAYVTIRDALKKSKKVAIGQVIIANRERIVALKACRKGLILETLRYNYEVRKAEKYFEDIDPNTESEKDQMDLALELIKRKSSDFNPTKFKDLYQEGLKEIIEAKMEKRAPRVKGEKMPIGKVISIMDALRKSVEQSKGGKGSESQVKSTSKKTAPKKSSAKSRSRITR